MMRQPLSGTRANHSLFQAALRPTFEAELVRLRSFGLIDHIKGKGIVAMKQEGQGDLNDHFRITDLGKEYLKLRREVMSEVKESVELGDQGAIR